MGRLLHVRALLPRYPPALRRSGLAPRPHYALETDRTSPCTRPHADKRCPLAHRPTTQRQQRSATLDVEREPARLDPSRSSDRADDDLSKCGSWPGGRGLVLVSACLARERCERVEGQRPAL